MTENTSKKPSGNEIREKFLQFFESKGHRRVRSSSLVPHGDPTLLFTNAGMNQFKDVFLGLEKRDYTRATTAQKCVRAGGKHNDLENVGFTKRHHTFFEMMGNFSFGDYFKKDAIAYAWELVTSPEWYGIPKDKLYVTIFGGAEVAPGTTLGVDEEARKYWLEQHVPADRIFAIPGLKDNFWAMGDTGPCGPCSELHYDMGSEASDEGHTDCKFPCDCGRYVEIWNLVFMQFNRFSQCERSGRQHSPEQMEAAQNEGKSVYEYCGCLRVEPLPKPCVDTGMGLERVAAVLQGVISNYHTDLFEPLLRSAGELTNTKLAQLFWPKEGKTSLATLQESEYGEVASLQVIADHSRAATFLIADDVLPTNDGRGYVLRKILRRAIQHGRLLGRKTPFLSELVNVVRDVMGMAYPELTEKAPTIARAISAEEERFLRTLDSGMKKLDEALYQSVFEAYRAHKNELLVSSPAECEEAERLLTDWQEEKTGDVVRYIANLIHDRLGIQIPFKGYRAFQVYDTYGVPRDFIEQSVRDVGLVMDTSEFESFMQEQRTRARASWKGTHKEAANPAYAKLAETFRTEPDFYSATTTKDCLIEAIITKNGSVSELKPGESGEVVLDRTAIYAESGGQMADTGAFYDSSESLQLAEVTGAFYPVAGLVAHKVTAKETLHVGDHVTVVADAERRERIMRNHSGTHLVHAALRNILGTHVKQAGSLNAPERLRFDFSHFAPVGQEELRDIEQQVNEEIRLNTRIETGVMALDEALNSGALAFFGDKYPESNVRVVTIPDPRAPRGFYSKELCGGTHVHRIGDIGVLKIVSEESVAAGVRRIEAVTGIGALEHYQQQANTLRELAGRLNVGEDSLLSSVEKLSQTARNLEKELGEEKRKRALAQFDDLDELIRKSREQVATEALVKGQSEVRLVKNVKLVLSQVEDVDRQQLREVADKVRQEIRSGVVVLASVENGNIALIVGVTKDLTAKVHAGKLIQALARQVGGSGGGRPDLAEAGGKDTSALKNALRTVPSLLEPLL